MQIKRYVWFVCTVFVLVQVALQASIIKQPQQQKEELSLTEEQIKQLMQFSTHGVIFFIDTLVKARRDAATFQLKLTLESQAAPLIVSSTIWHMFLQDSTHKNAYQKDKDQWDAYKISDHFYLLMPKSYLAILPQGKAAGRFFAQDITSGFKLSTFKKLDSATMLNPANFISVAKFTQNLSNPAQELSKLFITTITSNKIFITNQEYIEAGASEFIPRWSILMIAHGMQYRFDQEIAKLEKYLADPVGSFSPTALAEYNEKSRSDREWIRNQAKKDITAELNQLRQAKKQTKSATSGGIVAGIELTDMGKLLDFFNTKITVPFVMILSCYAAGTNLQKVLSDTVTTQFLTPHNFFLFSGAIAASPVIVQESYPYDFAQFFADLREPGPIKFEETNRAIHAYYDVATAPGYNNSLMVKPPGAPWMYPALMPKKVGSIGRAMNVRTDPLNPTTFFGGSNNTAALDVLLFYTDRVLFPLVIEKDPNGRIPVFISMMPGDSVLKIEQIIAPNVSFTELVQAFLKLKKLNDIKIFHIPNLTTQDYPQASQANNSSVLQDVIIMSIPGRLADDPIIKKVFFTQKVDGKKTFWHADLTRSNNLQDSLRQIKNQTEANKFIEGIKQQRQQKENLAFEEQLESLKAALTKATGQKIKEYQDYAAAVKSIKQLGAGLASIGDRA